MPWLKTQWMSALNELNRASTSGNAGIGCQSGSLRSPGTSREMMVSAVGEDGRPINRSLPGSALMTYTVSGHAPTLDGSNATPWSPQVDECHKVSSVVVSQTTGVPQQSS